MSQSSFGLWNSLVRSIQKMSPAAGLRAIEREIHDLRSLEFFSADFDVSGDDVEVPPQQKEGLRREWNEKRKDIVKRIRKISGYRYKRKGTTLTKFLKSVLLPPPFDSYHESIHGRTTEEIPSRYYPPQLFDWTEAFSNEVNGYSPEDESSKDNLNFDGNVLVDFISEYCGAKNAHDDEDFLGRNVWSTLQAFGVVTYKWGRERVDDGIGTESLPDYIALTDHPKGTNNKVPSAIMQIKATQRLLLPNGFVEINEQYLKGMKNKSSSSYHWSMVCNPIAETIGYMIKQDCRYGALCTATKTYFIHIDTGYRCKITNAWFTFDKNFVKAWATFFHLANKNYDESEIPKPPRRWYSNKPKDIHRILPRKRTSGGLQEEEEDESSSSNHVPPPFDFEFELDFVPFVPDSEFEIDKERRDPIIMKANWKGTTVALKEVGIDKRVDRYKKEVEAYKMLRGAWGKHVATPLFISRHWFGWIGYLGFTMGKELSEEDMKQNGNRYRKQFLEKVRILENEFGFCHMDVWEDISARNYIVDENDNVLISNLQNWEPKKLSKHS